MSVNKKQFTIFHSIKDFKSKDIFISRYLDGQRPEEGGHSQTPSPHATGNPGHDHLSQIDFDRKLIMLIPIYYFKHLT